MKQEATEVPPHGAAQAESPVFRPGSASRPDAVPIGLDKEDILYAHDSERTSHRPARTKGARVDGDYVFIDGLHGDQTFEVEVATTLNNRLRVSDPDVYGGASRQAYGLIGPVRLVPYGEAAVRAH